MKKGKLLLLFVFLTCIIYGQETVRQYLSGTDKDHTVQWDFFCTKGRNSGSWTKIAVPSSWELQGFGQYNYGHDTGKLNEDGLYKYRFDIPAEWKNKITRIVFGGAMTDVEVKLNGKPCGPLHQGGFYEFKYDVTKLLKYGRQNLLEVTVYKASSNKKLERAERGGDFWAFGGIYRPVYLEVMPAAFIDRVAIDAKANGSFNMQVFTAGKQKDATLEAEVQTLQGIKVGNTFNFNGSLNSMNELKQSFNNVLLWNPEHPNLYQVKVSLKQGNQTVHTITQRFGFRTAELRPRDGFYINGVKVVFKGVDRHSEWPKTGRTLSRDIHLLDIALMKDMNMNAVRMSHYPPDPEFLDLCDSLGLMVLDELTGWQAAYDTAVGKKLVKELVVRDVNHPSIVIWDNGNEGGWNRALDNDYALYDPQHRLVIHPWEKFNGTDTKHYPDYNYIVNAGLYSNDIFFPTEFMHGLYDGGHAAGLEDFWNRMIQHPNNAGGFLWAFHDEGVVRTDMDSIIDCHGNNAPDGIVGPYREKEGSYYAIKEIWSPVYISQKIIPSTFDGNIAVENRYHFTNLNECSFVYKLVKFPLPEEAKSSYTKTDSNSITIPSIKPGEKVFINLPLPAEWRQSQALYLTAYDKNKHEICTWSWSLQSAAETAKAAMRLTASTLSIKSEFENNQLKVVGDGIAYYFDTTTGYLSKVIKPGNKVISLSGGPVVAGLKQTTKSFNYHNDSSGVTVSVSYTGEGWSNIKWTFTSGKPAKLEYSFNQKGEADFIGIGFKYPEENITGIKWLGRGPYHVWKNRLQGMQYNVWQKDYNNTVTGESWNYPEFKGYHSNLNWLTVQNKESDFTVYAETDNLFLQLLKPQRPKAAGNDNTSPAFPATDIGFMHAIPPIGTKFQNASVMGPESQKNTQLNYAPVSGVLWFDFR